MFPRWLTVLPVIWFSSGCTHCVLKENTLSASSTLSSLQTQQVLNNLAMLSCDQAANPCHLNLSGGLVQATDQKSATMLGSLFSSGLASINSFNPSVSAQRGVVEQWSVNPVTDAEQLESLRIAYRKALVPNDPQIDDLIINQLIGLCVRFSLLPKEATLRRNFDHERKDNKAYEVLRGIFDALTAESKKIDEKIARMSFYADRLRKAQPKEAYEIEMRILELKDKKTLRDQQKALLRDLAGHKEPSANLRLLQMLSSGPQRSPHGIAHANASETTLFILTALQAKQDAAPGYVPATDIISESTRNPATADQIEDQITRWESLLDEKFQGPWIHHGCKKDIPPCACYVGHFKGCGKECYVWVMPEQYEILREFTQIILSQAAATAPSEFPSLGPAFSPALR